MNKQLLGKCRNSVALGLSTPDCSHWHCQSTNAHTEDIPQSTPAAQSGQPSAKQQLWTCETSARPCLAPEDSSALPGCPVPAFGTPLGLLLCVVVTGWGSSCLGDRKKDPPWVTATMAVHLVHNIPLPCKVHQAGMGIWGSSQAAHGELPGVPRASKAPSHPSWVVFCWTSSRTLPCWAPFCDPAQTLLWEQGAHKLGRPPGRGQSMGACLLG